MVSRLAQREAEIPILCNEIEREKKNHIDCYAPTLTHSIYKKDHQGIVRHMQQSTRVFQPRDFLSIGASPKPNRQHKNTVEDPPVI